MFQLSQYPVEQISQNFQKRFNGFKERSIPFESFGLEERLIV